MSKECNAVMADGNGTTDSGSGSGTTAPGAGPTTTAGGAPSGSTGSGNGSDGGASSTIPIDPKTAAEQMYQLVDQLTAAVPGLESYDKTLQRGQNTSLSVPPLFVSEAKAIALAYPMIAAAVDESRLDPAYVNELGPVVVALREFLRNFDYTVNRKRADNGKVALEIYSFAQVMMKTPQTTKDLENSVANMKKALGRSGRKKSKTPAPVPVTPPVSTTPAPPAPPAAPAAPAPVASTPAPAPAAAAQTEVAPVVYVSTNPPGGVR